MSGITQAANEPQKPDVRVLIDISGSMKQNDPKYLRRPAFDLLVGLFPKDSKAGVWAFGEKVAVLVPDKNVSDGWRALARSKSRTNHFDSLYTNIPAVLESAAQSRSPTIAPALFCSPMAWSIFRNRKRKTKLRASVCSPRFCRVCASAGIVVHTIALSKSADRELMERLAADTGGLFAVAETADQLKQVFLQAFDAAAPAEQVPLAGNHFLVDSSIDELTALVLHKPGKPVELVSPDNKRHSASNHGDDFKWFEGDGFDLITVTKPYEGEWNVVADVEKGSRVTIVSNLSLAASRYAESLFVGGAPLDMLAALKQQGEVVKDATFIKLVKFGATVQRREDGKQWSLDLSAANPVPADGYFRSALSMLSEPGTYDLAMMPKVKRFSAAKNKPSRCAKISMCA